MATIPGLTNLQNARLADLAVGDLLLVHNPYHEPPLNSSGWDCPSHGYTGHVEASNDVPLSTGADHWDSSPRGYAADAVAHSNGVQGASRSQDYSSNPNAGAAIGDPGPDGHVSEDSNYIHDRPGSPWVEEEFEDGEQAASPPIHARQHVLTADSGDRVGGNSMSQHHDRPGHQFDASLSHSTSLPGSIRVANDALIHEYEQEKNDATTRNHFDVNIAPHRVTNGDDYASPDSGPDAFDSSTPTNPRNPSHEDGPEYDGDASDGAAESDDGSFAEDADEPNSENDDGGDSDPEDNDSEDSRQSMSSKPSHMFAVHTIYKNGSGEITDMLLRLLHYEPQPNMESARGEHSFQIYGTDCVYQPLPGPGSDAPYPAVASIKNIVDHPTFDIFPKPDDREAKDVLGYDTRCPMTCEDGRLDSIFELDDTVPDYQSPVVVAHRPLCPCCMGIALVQEEQLLRSLGAADMGRIVDYLGRVNQRLANLGYPFRQFDEREWGYEFADIDDQDVDGDNPGREDQFEQWREAQDPNNNIVTKPASEITIAALPRRTYAEVKPADKEDEGPCAICREDMQDDTQVTVLACKHFFCASGCLETWLRQFSTCPACRARVREYALPQNDHEHEVHNALDYIFNMSTSLVRVHRMETTVRPLHAMAALYETELRAALQNLCSEIIAGQRHDHGTPPEVAITHAASLCESLRILFPLDADHVWRAPNHEHVYGTGRTLRESQNTSRRLTSKEIQDFADDAVRRMYRHFSAKLQDALNLNEFLEALHSDAERDWVVDGREEEVTEMPTGDEGESDDDEEDQDGDEEDEQYEDSGDEQSGGEDDEEQTDGEEHDAADPDAGHWHARWGAGRALGE